MAGRFGAIQSDLSLAAGQSVRRNAGDTAFEAFTPFVLPTDPNADRILFWDDSAGSAEWLTVGSGLSISGTTLSAAGGGLTIGNAVSGGGANRVLYEDGSQNLATDADFTFDGTMLKVGNATTTDQTTIKLDHTGGYAVASERRIDWESGGTVYSRIANYYLKYSDAGSPGLAFFTGADNTTPALQLKGDKTAVFGGTLSLTSGLTVSKSSTDALTVTHSGSAGSVTGVIYNWAGASGSDQEFRLDFKAGGTLYARQAMYYDGSIVGLAFYTNSNVTTPVLKLGSPTGTQARFSYDGSNYMTLAVGSTGGVTLDAVGSGAKFTFSDDVEMADAKNIALNTTTGTKIGTGTTQKLGFFNATPVTQRSDFGALTDSTGATAVNTITAVSATYDEGEHNANYASLTAKINALRTVLRDLGLMA